VSTIRVTAKWAGYLWVGIATWRYMLDVHPVIRIVTSTTAPIL
jgi:hypothetical protein